MKRILCLVLSLLVALPASADMDVRGELKNAQLEKLSSEPTGAEARVYYDTVTKKAKIHNGTAFQDLGSGSGGGSAGVNLVENGTFEDAAITCWAAYDDGAASAPVDADGGSPSLVTVSRTTTSGELITGDGSLKIVKGSGDAQGEGVACEVTLAANSPLKSGFNSLDFTYYMSATNGPPIAVYVVDATGGAPITGGLQFDSCGSASDQVITATTTSCAARLYWQGNGSASYRLAFHVTDGDTDAVTTYVDDLHFGSRSLADGPQIGPVTAYTPTAAGLGAGSATPTFFWWRENDRMRIVGRLAKDGTPGSGASDVTITLPTGYTGNTALTPTSNFVGTGTFVGATFQGHTDAFLSTTTTVRFAKNGGGDYFKGADFTAGGLVTFNLDIPITEWVGGSSIGDGLIEYACNSDTTDANVTASGLNSDCEAGAQFGSYTTATRQKRSRFKTPYVPGRDLVFMEVKDGAGGGNNWQPHGGSRFTPLSATTGMQFTQVTSSSTDFDTWFGSGGYGATPLAGAGTWSAVAGSDSYKWRLVKVRGGKTVAPPASATETGLVSTTTQTFAGAKTFSSAVTFNSGLKHTLGGAVVMGSVTSGGSVSSGTYTVNCSTNNLHTVNATGDFAITPSNVSNGQICSVIILANGGARTITPSRAAAYVQGGGAGVVISSGDRAIFTYWGGDSFPVMTYVNGIN